MASRKIAVKWVQPRKLGQVVVILCAAVEEPEGGERVEFLGHYGFLWICHEQRWLEFQKRRVRDLNRSWDEHVPKTNVDLHRYSRLCNRRIEPDMHTLVLRVFLDPLDLNGGRIKVTAIRFRGESAKFADQRPNDRDSGPYGLIS